MSTAASITIPGPYELGRKAGTAVVQQATDVRNTVIVFGVVLAAIAAAGYIAYRVKGGA